MTFISLQQLQQLTLELPSLILFYTSPTITVSAVREFSCQSLREIQFDNLSKTSHHFDISLLCSQHHVISSNSADGGLG